MEQRASLTAQGLAIMRAVESQKPEGERLFYDPYARHFVNPWLLRLTALLMRSGHTERRGPGVHGYPLERTRYIADYLVSCVRNGSVQLVILGADYDARAYRFADALRDKVRVFEVGHPATQAVKSARLGGILGGPPAHVSFVSEVRT